LVQIAEWTENGLQGCLEKFGKDRFVRWRLHSATRRCAIPQSGIGLNLHSGCTLAYRRVFDHPSLSGVDYRSTTKNVELLNSRASPERWISVSVSSGTPFFVIRTRYRKWKIKFRVRFAPSPYRVLHIGGLADSSLYIIYFGKTPRRQNSYFAIEDTDQSRKIEGAVENLIETLNWSGNPNMTKARTVTAAIASLCAIADVYVLWYRM